MKNSQKMIRQAWRVFAAPCALALLCSPTAFAQDASTTYNPARKDPFVKYKPPVKRKVVKKVATPVVVPPVEARIERYKAMKAAAMNLQQPAPKPTTALLLSEVQVTGIFRTPRGYAAMIEATPINLSYVIYPGERFYDGMLVAIEEHRLVFRRETVWTDGRRDVAVDAKPLRQPDAVRDSLTTTKTTVATKQSASEATDKKETRPESASTNGNR
jgi:hypothetical protein